MLNHFAVFGLLALPVIANAQEPQASSMVHSIDAVDVERSASARLNYEKLPEAKRRAIESFLVAKLGLSSTGSIRIVALYKNMADRAGTFLHFQQQDLLGMRLVWSVIVDADAMAVRVMYHWDDSVEIGTSVPLESWPRR